MRRWIYFAGLLVLGVVVAAAQDSPAPGSAPPPANASKPARKKAPPSASQDAVPDAPLPSAAPSPPGVTPSGDAGSAASATPPESPTPAGKKKSAAEDNPFPEEDSKAAAKADAQGAAADQPGAAPAGQDGGAVGSSSQQGLDKLDLYGEKDRKSRKNADPDAGLAYDPKLAAQDDKIGDFYLKNGNAPGAYARYKEATQHDAGDADAVFGMAEAARQMNMMDEAVAGFQTYIFAFPDGPKARVAKKALAELKVKSRS